MTSIPVLLQVQVQLPKANPVAILVVLGVVVVITVFFLINARRRPSRGAAQGAPRFTKGKFRRTARQRGLSYAQAKTLEDLVLKYRPSAPMSIFSSSRALDILLGKAIEEIKKHARAEETREAQINTIYRIKQLLERAGNEVPSLRSTNELRAGQDMWITVENGVRCASRVTGTLRNALAAQVPLDETGNEVRWKKWTPVEVFFSQGGGMGSAFESKVLGYSVLRGVKSVLLQHSNSVQAAAQRKFRRKQLDRPAYFYAIQVMTVGTGRNAAKKAVPQTKGALGTMLDVSAGGCAVKSTFPLPKGSLIKVEFETERRRQVAVYGKVKGVRKAQPIGGIMHVMFTRISRKNLNQINSFVYDIG